MDGFKALNFENKFIAFFAVTSLLIVIFTGVVAGIGINIILFRALISVIIFSGLAYAIIFVLRSFLPEVYSILNKSSSNKMMDVTPEELEKDKGGAETSEEPLTESTGGEKESAGVPGEEIPSVEAKDSVGQPDLSEKETKLGKHLMKFEGIEKYEPKIMAEAVRTMMSKDEE